MLIGAVDIKRWTFKGHTSEVSKKKKKKLNGVLEPMCRKRILI